MVQFHLGPERGGVLLFIRGHRGFPLPGGPGSEATGKIFSVFPAHRSPRQAGAAVAQNLTFVLGEVRDTWVPPLQGRIHHESWVEAFADPPSPRE